jgi:hypothetical protein
VAPGGWSAHRLQNGGGSVGLSSGLGPLPRLARDAGRMPVRRTGLFRSLAWHVGLDRIRRLAEGNTRRSLAEARIGVGLPRWLGLYPFCPGLP